ncbi:MAG: outer membrane protein assembly factor BamD [Rickettsiales bacterium]
MFSRSFLALLIAASLALCGCGMFTHHKKEAKDDAPVASSDELFDKGVKLLKAGKYKQSREAFGELDATYPYSSISARGSLLSSYAAYSDGDYDGAAATLDSFVKLHPAHKDVAYAYYLKALSYYDRIADIGRDQSVTAEARQALLDVIRRFPDGEYARDAKLKLDLVQDHLAGKEVAVGRFYQKQLKPAAAVNRFTTVLKKYQTTAHVQEALYRLTETYYSIGVLDEAQKYAALLGYNYPKSRWYGYAYRLMKGKTPSLSGGALRSEENAPIEKGEAIMPEEIKNGVGEF